jgi:hypothetical protein
MRRHVLVISRNERIGRWFRFAIGGLRTGLPTTVVTDLDKGLLAMKRLLPRVVIFVEDGTERDDDRLMLLQALLLIEKQNRQNTLALLYDVASGGITMVHHAHLQHVRPEDVAAVAAETVHCPLFGWDEEGARGFPENCRLRPLMRKGAAHAAGAVPSAPKG